MSRTPLRPLASVISARNAGEDPDAIQATNLRHRHEEMEDRERQRAESRLLVLGLAFFVAFTVVGLRMGMLASADATEPRADLGGSEIVALRADILDRNGAVLATNLTTNSLYAQPPLMIDKAAAAISLAMIFPDLDAEELAKDFASKRKFIWLRRKISPEQQQLVHDIGEPGLLFGPREMRLYPNGMLAAHILGGAGFGREGVHSAEVIGVAGVEHQFDSFLRDPALQGEPLELSIDLTVQAATKRVLLGGMKLLKAKGAAAVLMDVHTGEVISMVSLPDFDPNDRPKPLTKGDASDSPMFNRAAQGLYELGSTFKLFTAAMALEYELATPETMIDTKGPLKWGKYKIKDFHNYGAQLSLTDVIVKSSNIGSANLALEIGGGRQQTFLDSLGLFSPLPLEIVEAKQSRPLLPKQWSEISTMTISYGHGIAASPMHLAAAYSSLLNGGTFVAPTLLKTPAPSTKGVRIVSEETSRALRMMLRQVVLRGTASMGDVEGYHVGGKTGTADKPDPKGGYYDDRVIATFASVFPAHDPKYVLVVTLDEPVETSGDKPRRTAGWTAVPVASEIIRRVAPLLGMRPEIEPIGAIDYTLSKY
ncbi:MAG: cell division protein FtsI (penicillin-binding protein 3) [Paracoccaceae bacterium]|jgi:cell division protein FtsI (penicillin-binding protein 3)